MKRRNNMYYILTYLFFIYPPFILMLLELYRGYGRMHISAFNWNIVVLLVLFAIVLLLIYTKRLHKPDKTEMKYLLFGFIGNIISFLYTFQNSLNIDHIITIYLMLLAVIGVHTLLISRKLRPLELYIFLPIFLLYDSLFYTLKNCGWENQYTCRDITTHDGFLVTFYIIIVIGLVLFYIYKILSYRNMSILKGIAAIVIAVLSFVVLTEMDIDYRFAATLYILLAFIVILDFIVGLVNKTYTHKTILYYARALLILGYVFIVSEEILNPYRGYSASILVLMVIATYAALGLSILKTILKVEVKNVALLDLFKKSETVVKYSKLTLDEMVQIESTFTSYLDRMKFDENEYNMKVTRGKEILGLLHSDFEILDKSIGVVQARVYFIEVSENPYTLSNGLLYSVERYYKSQGIGQIKYLAHIEETEIIKLLLERGYIPVDIKDQGFYYFIKSL